jgi:hypothetical protein
MLGVLSFLASVSLAYGLVSKGYNNPVLPPRPLAPAFSAPDALENYAFRIAQSDEEHPSLKTVYLFDQYVDHNDHTQGTFKQRYWVSWEFYEPGGDGSESSTILA